MMEASRRTDSNGCIQREMNRLPSEHQDHSVFPRISQEPSRPLLMIRWTSDVESTATEVIVVEVKTSKSSRGAFQVHTLFSYKIILNPDIRHILGKFPIRYY